MNTLSHLRYTKECERQECQKKIILSPVGSIIYNFRESQKKVNYRLSEICLQVKVAIPIPCNRIPHYNAAKKNDTEQTFTAKKYCNITQFPGVDILWKGTIFTVSGSVETMLFQKISTPEN